MKILHVVTTLNPDMGGVTKAVTNLCEVLQEKSIESEILTLDIQSNSWIKEINFKCYTLGPAIGVWQYNSGVKDWLKANLLEFDIILIHGLWVYHSYVTWKVFAKLKKQSGGNPFPKLLVMPHGMLDPYFQVATNRRLKALRNNIYWQFIERHVINDADGLLFTCETELLLARETFKPYKPKHEYNVGYGISLPPVFNQQMSDAFYNKCSGLDEAPYLLFLSRIHPKKGVDLLISTYIKITKARLEAGLTTPKLVIAGPGLETTFGKKILKEVVQSQLSEYIFFPGMLHGNEKWGAFYNCDAFILPSHQENFGIAVAESLACGKPVLISDQVNIWREIEQGKGGLIEPDNLTGIENLITKWLKCTFDEKTAFGLSALDVYNNCFTNDIVLKRMVGVLNDIA